MARDAPAVWVAPVYCRKLTLKEYSDKFLKWFQIVVDMIEKWLSNAPTLDDFVVVSR